MNMLKVASLKARRPLSCGVKADNENYLLWKIVQSQRWRFEDVPEMYGPFKPPTKFEIWMEHAKAGDKPRKGDLVSLDDDRHGQVEFIFWDSGAIEEITVKLYDNTEVELDPGYFTCYVTHAGRTRWLIET